MSMEHEHAWFIIYMDSKLLEGSPLEILEVLEIFSVLKEESSSLIASPMVPLLLISNVITVRISKLMMKQNTVVMES
jgi:hypothetical protein